MVDKDLQNAGQEPEKDSVALTEDKENNAAENNSAANTIDQPVAPDPVKNSAGETADVKVEESIDSKQEDRTIEEESTPAENNAEIVQEVSEEPSKSEMTDSEESEQAESVEATAGDTESVTEVEASDDSEDSKNEPAPESVPEVAVNEEKVEQANTDKPEAEVESKDDATDSDHAESHAETEEEKEEEIEEIDFSTYTKEQLSTALQELVDSENIQKARKRVDDIFHAFEEILNKEKEEAKKLFVDGGGEEEGFQYALTDIDNRIEASYRLLKDRISQHFRKINQEKEVNYQHKLDLLEKMREVVDGDEDEASFREFKKLQDEWKETGPVPNQHNRTLWANYHALLDRFYDHRSIYFELKELDRKKNLESKIELVKRAEALDSNENLKSAIQELNELHQEFKNIGPVPRDHQEDLWLKFKAASDAIYKKRKEFFADQKSKLGENLDKKKELVEKLAALAQFDSKDAKEWNARTKEIVAVQKEWEAIGGLPKAKAKEVNKDFWGNFKKYFSAKNRFFKSLESEREDNLKIKEGLIAQVEVLKDSTDWNKTSEEIKKLQLEWKKSGPVPFKHRNEVYNRFKAACDHFFKARREASGDIEKEFQENLTQKEAIIEKIKALKPEATEELHQLQNEFNEIGFVPKNAIKSIRHHYNEAVGAFIKKSNVGDDEKAKMKIESEMQDLMTGPNADRRVRQKEQGLRKQISKVEEEIALYKNNMEFFTGSSKAQTFKDQFTSKIEKAQTELEGLKKQLKVLRQMS